MNEEVVLTVGGVIGFCVCFLLIYFLLFTIFRCLTELILFLISKHRLKTITYKKFCKLKYDASTYVSYLYGKKFGEEIYSYYSVYELKIYLLNNFGINIKYNIDLY